jgi:hypothetical protein
MPMLPSAALEKIDTGIKKVTPQRTATLHDPLAPKCLAVSILRAEGMGKGVCFCNSNSERRNSESSLNGIQIPRGAVHGRYDNNSVPGPRPLCRPFVSSFMEDYPTAPQRAHSLSFSRVVDVERAFLDPESAFPD